MNRNLDAAATVLGLGPRIMRRRLRELGVLDHEGGLAARYRDKGNLYIDSRSRWDYRINGYSHYPVVMVTEKGVAWLAEQLGIQITTMPPGNAGSQA